MSLVQIEKESVLKKMKEQEKHVCGCAVCSRKRTAIEEELEGLYSAYYEELEQFANHPQQDAYPPMMGVSPSQKDDDVYSDEDLDEDTHSGDEPEDVPRDYASDFLNFDSSLTVQGESPAKAYLGKA